MSRKRSALGVITGLVAWGLAVPVGVTVAAPAETVPTSTITLLTGDKVVLGGPRGARVLPARGRERIGFRQSKDVYGDIHVVPDDAVPLLQANRIDPRLFNVTKLVAGGYDDTQRTDIPLIVSGPDIAATKVLDLPSIHGTAVRMDKAIGLSQLPPDSKIWLDGPVRAALDKSIPQVGAPEAWRSGHTGTGTTVAVLDTGIDASHPDLAGAVLKAENFSTATTGPDDYFGHGTHVASIITGDHPKYPGVAPDTKLLNGKVVDDAGFGTESQVIAGMQWATAQGADVVNMSLSFFSPSDGTDPLSQAVDRLTAETGTLFVIAAGNNPIQPPAPPGAADSALTVGAVDHNDQLAEFSTRGPRFGDDAIKPDMTAPGVGIAAAKTRHGTTGEPVDDTHVRKSGTSMATPHVAGAAAILAGQHPDWGPERIKATLMGSAKPHPTLSVFEQGAGRLDVARAVSQTLQAVPASISAGVARWPHHDDVPITKTLTYHNSGTVPITASPTIEIRDPAGNPAPAGMFTFSPSTVTIPAGGQAQVTVTIDTRITAPDGLYSGVVLTGDIRTPIAVNRELESYDVTVRFIGLDGNPTPDYSYTFTDLDRAKSVAKHNASGTVVARLAKGVHYFHAAVRTPAGTALASEPEYVVARDSSFTVDTRTARPAGFTVDNPGARPGVMTIRTDRGMPSGQAISDEYTIKYHGALSVLPSRTSAPPGQFTYIAESRMAEPDGKSGFTTTTYLYNLRQTTDRRVPAEPMHRVHDSQLVKVRSEHATTAPGKYGDRESVVVKQLPYTLNEFYTPGVPWEGNFTQLDSARRDTHAFRATPRVFTEDTSEKWNFGVFGPALPTEGRSRSFRIDNLLVVNVGLATDQSPNRYGTAGDLFGTADGTGSTTLYLDGKPLSTTPYGGFVAFNVPPGLRTYSVHSESRNPLSLSGTVTADWTFTSDTTPASVPKPLPLLTVRFTPALNAYNQAPRAIPTVVPITVEHNADATAGKPAVQVSHDNGTTWKPVPVLTVNGKRFTILTHPAGAKSVSLKASARDADGNSVDQTILNAFHLR
ncbi:subtilisin family serine protease [Kibdelosporangium banguiense]|uniref:Subtilisin family serine protease n=1 Tax=Kibdelosporangium banguiense TaxID=1365924 RepID=A0ABS4TVH7_9PSEU|nr:S8 family serine peptidase [Kibdelosporangium banguiense]MBP2328413.1 subtilisin family serine protease [Kibdelosporangium banguiense]